MRQYKDQVQSKATTPVTTPNHQSAFSSVYSEKENDVATEELLLYYYDPQKEVSKYREKRETEARVMMESCREKN